MERQDLNPELSDSKILLLDTKLHNTKVSPIAVALV